MSGRLREWRVTWEMEVDGETAAEAAREARNVQLDPASTATVFKVAREGARGLWIRETVDLGPLEYQAFLLILGNAVDGLMFRGPFPTAEAATEYGEERHSREPWVVSEMYFEV